MNRFSKLGTILPGLFAAVILVNPDDGKEIKVEGFTDPQALFATYNSRWFRDGNSRTVYFIVPLLDNPPSVQVKTEDQPIDPSGDPTQP